MHFHLNPYSPDSQVVTPPEAQALLGTRMDRASRRHSQVR